MSKLTIYNMEGSSVGDLEVSDDLLVLDRGEQALRDVIIATLAGRRAGTASTLRKGEVAGSNRKPWKQKGTGRARAGYRQSPVWRGGAVAFGPHPRSYAVKINKKVKSLAFRRAFSEKVAAGEVSVLEDLSMPEARTKAFVAMLKALGASRGALFIVDKIDKNAALSCRNIPMTTVVSVRDVNAYQLIRYPAIVVSKTSVAELEKRLAGRNKVAE